jgi:hypothetical protein
MIWYELQQRRYNIRYVTWQRLLAIQEFSHEHQGQIFMKLWLLKKEIVIEGLLLTRKVRSVADSVVDPDPDGLASFCRI